MGEYTTHVTLLARIAAGADPGAWREFCDRYGELVDGFARRQGLQPADREEVVQEVLTALSKSMPGFRYDPTKGKFRSYLKTITLRVIWRLARQKRGEVPLGDDECNTAVAAATADEAIDDLWEAEWRHYHLRQAMRHIELEFNAKDRAAFLAYALEGRPVQEVASAEEMSVDQVYQAKSRILRRLSAIVARQVQEEG